MNQKRRWQSADGASPPSGDTEKIFPLYVKAIALPSGEIATSRSQRGESATALDAARQIATERILFFMINVLLFEDF